MRINNRIEKIADHIDETELLVDVGGDHSYLGIYCVRNGITKRALVTDIKEGPLIRARKNIASYDLDHLIDTRQTDGLEDVKVVTGDTIVISGMGAEVIIGILDRAKEKFFSNNDIIIQPANAPELLKMYLFRNGFEVVFESHLIYRKLPYVILKCRMTGKKTAIEDGFDIRLFTPVCMDLIDKEALLSYLERVLNRQKKNLERYYLN